MLSKIFYLCLIISVCSAEDMFETLYRDHKANQVTACPQSKRARACAGLAWTRRWALVRASCIREYSFESIYVKRGIVNCSHDMTPATIRTEDQGARQVVARYTHPAFPGVDLALLHLDRPYAIPALIDNRTSSDNILNKLDTWIKNILFMESMRMIKPVSYRNHLKMYSTPLRMFLVTVVLPSSAFIVFFLFIIFFTGKSKGNRIHYKSLNGDKKETTNV